MAGSALNLLTYLSNHLQLLPGIDFTEQLENENEVEPLLPQPKGTLPRNDENNSLSESLGKLKLNPENNRFFGKSR
jgi:hypothetical protein